MAESIWHDHNQAIDHSTLFNGPNPSADHPVQGSFNPHPSGHPLPGGGGSSNTAMDAVRGEMSKPGYNPGAKAVSPEPKGMVSTMGGEGVDLTPSQYLSGGAMSMAPTFGTGGKETTSVLTPHRDAEIMGGVENGGAVDYRDEGGNKRTAADFNTQRNTTHQKERELGYPS